MFRLSNTTQFLSREALYFCIRWCLCALLALPFAAAASDAVVERAYLEDPTNALQLSDVQSAAQAKNFKRFSGPLNRGYSASAFWLRLKIQPVEKNELDLIFNYQGLGQLYVLRIQPSYLDEIALYDPQDIYNAPRFVGDVHPLPEGQYHSLNHNFVISAVTQPREIWLRLKTNSTNLIQVEALPMEQAIAKDGIQDLVLGVFIGSLMLFFGWALVHWFEYRERLIGVLAVNQFLALVFALAILGYFRFLLGSKLPVYWLDMATNILALVATASSLYFNTLFLSEFQPPRLARLFLFGLVCMFPVELLLLFMGHVRLSMQLNMLVVATAGIMFFVAATMCRAWSDTTQQEPPVLSKKWLMSFYSVSILLLLAFALPSLGITPSTELALQTNSIYGFVTGMVLIVTLQLRARRIQAAHLEGQKRLALAQLQVEQETKQRLEQVQFMAMLTHELKTPLSVVRMALGMNESSQKIKERADQAIQDMSNVIDRCAWIDRLHEREFSIKNSGFDLMQELDRLIFVSNTQGRIRRTTSIETCPVTTDVRMICTILNNLLDNALKYSQAGSTIEVQVTLKLQDQTPTVAVNVASIPGHCGRPDAARVFEKYYRNAGARHQTGSGLGLYQAAHIATQLGGELRYVPDETFVRFEFCLPC
jgi:signal transduction histidine kinase